MAKSKAKELVANVFVHPDDEGRHGGWVGPDYEQPTPEQAARITNPAAWGEDVPERSADGNPSDEEELI